jgi:hypothetical protein
MRYTLLSALILPALVGPVLAGDITYKEYAKAPEVWRRGYVSGIAEYMSRSHSQTKRHRIPHGTF